MRIDRRYLPLAALALAGALSACTTFQTGQSKLQAVKTVGIISGIGDRMTFTEAGLLGPGNHDQSFPIGAWDIDGMVVQQATAALGGAFQVRPVTYQPAAFSEMRKDSALTPVNLVRGDPVKQLVRTAVTPQGLDAYVVITKARVTFGSSGKKIEGIGLVSYGTVMASYSRVHVLYEVRVIDGKTFDVIEKRTADPLGEAEDMRLPGPSEKVDPSYAKVADPVNNEALHQAVTSLLTSSLASTLSDMHLTDLH